MKKTILLLVTWTMLSTSLRIFQSCCNPDPINYRLKSVTGGIERTVGVEYLGNYHQKYYVAEPFEYSANGIAYDSLGILLINDIETCSSNSKGELFFSSYACSPDVNFEILADVEIISNRDYYTFFPSGTNLKDLISIRQGFNSFLVNGESMVTFLPNAEIVGNGYITFNYPPEENNIHDLIIKFFLRDGREYSTILQGLKINE